MPVRIPAQAQAIGRLVVMRSASARKASSKAPLKSMSTSASASAAGQIRSFRALSHRCLGRQFRLGGRLVVERLGKIEIVELEFRREIDLGSKIELRFRLRTLRSNAASS